MSKGENINDSKFCRFGFYSGQGLLNAPTAGWFQWLTFPLNGNIKYPAQLGFWIDNHTNNARMYTRAMSSATGSEIWSSWNEIITNDKILIIDKLFTFPEGTTTRGTLNGDKGSIDNKGKTLINYSVLGVNSGSEFHVQNMVVNLDGSYSVIYDKQGTNSFNARISMLFM